MENNKNYIHVERHKWPDEIEAEKRRTKKRFGVVLLCVACFAFGFMASVFSDVSSSSIPNTSNVSDSNKFNEIYDIMRNDWFYGKDIKDLDTFLMTNAINGLSANEYDTHSNYLTKKSASNFMQKLEGSIVGIGIEYRQVNDINSITKVYASSPAEKAGVKEGDRISKINGISVDGKTLDEVKELITGEEGTSVSFSVLRGDEEITMDIVRSNVGVTAYGYVKDDIAVLELSSFSDTSAKESERYLKQFKDKGVDRLILDVRSNSGGYIDSAVKIASLFLEPGKVVLHEEVRNGKIKDFITQESNHYKFDDIVILVNENTASAAEVIAACLNEHLNATLVGVKTYGKGSVQTQKVFSDGSYFKYTTAQWTTPNGKVVNKIGLTPDIEAKLDDVFTYSVPEDDKEYKVDTVGDNVKSAQVFLHYLGYGVDRKDGYYSNATLEAVKSFQTSQGIKVDGIISKQLIQSMMTMASEKTVTQLDENDLQMIKAIEVINGK